MILSSEFCRDIAIIYTEHSVAYVYVVPKLDTDRISPIRNTCCDYWGYDSSCKWRLFECDTGKYTTRPMNNV